MADGAGISTLITSLDPTPVYAASREAAQYVGFVFTPILLLIAIFVRTMETQLDQFAGQGKWALAVRDFLLWGTVLAAYFGIATLLTDFFNQVYISVDRIGSLDLITNQLATLMEKADAKQDGDGVIAMVLGAGATLLKAVTFLFYYFSLIVVSFLAAFLKVAHAIGYSMGFLWGLIAIPVSITSKIKILRPWATFLGIILLWPFVQGMMLALFAPVFANAAKVLLSDPDFGSASTGASIYMLYTVLNLIVSALLVAAPLVTSALVTSGAVTGLVVPFTAAAIGAGLGLAKATEGGVKGRVDNLRAWAKDPLGYKAAQEKVAGGTGPRGRLAAATNTPRPGSASSVASRAPVKAAAPPIAQAGAEDDAGAPPPTSAPEPMPEPSTDAKRRQARRGVFVNKAKQGPK